jgi:uncharacterized membrane protein YkoI
MKIQLFATGVAVAAVSSSLALADRPAADDKPIVEIVQQLEQQGYGPFSELDFDEGNWEVEVYKDDAAYELTVDGRSGKILSEHRDDAEQRPPRDAQPLSQILHTLIKAGYTHVHDVSFERRYWEIEAFRQDAKYEIHVHPTTGEPISNRRDD